MRILFLSSWFPHPPDNGARIRTFNLLRKLGRRHEIGLLSFVRGDRPSPQPSPGNGEGVGGEDRPSLQPSPRRGEGEEGKDSGEVESFCRVLGVVPYRESRSSRLETLVRLFSPVPRSVLESHSPQMEAQMQEILRNHTFDVIVASEIGPGVCTVPYVLGRGAIPRVIEDLELSMIWNQIPAQHTWVGRARHGLTWWKQRRYATRVLRQVEGCTVASEQERALLLGLVPDFEPLAVVPNGVDLERYQGDWQPAVPGTLIFPGALTYQANFDAMAFFLEAVFPLIRAKRPGVTLRITGRTDGVPLHRLPAGDGVIFTGYLDDVRPAIAQSQVCVVPLLMGGGTRLKILEAMALGTPVVSTSRGAEGLKVTCGEQILIADEPAAIADAILLLMDDPALRSRLSVNGQRLVEDGYSWETCGRRLEQLLDQVVGQRGGTT